MVFLGLCYDVLDDLVFGGVADARHKVGRNL